MINGFVTTESSNEFYEKKFKEMESNEEEKVKLEKVTIFSACWDCKENEAFSKCQKNIIYNKNGDVVCYGTGLVLQEKTMVNKFDGNSMTRSEMEEIELYYQDLEKLTGNFPYY